MHCLDLVTDHAAADDASLMLAALKGNHVGELPDGAETQAFCDRLKGFTWRSYRANLAAPDRTPLPRGYRNIRVHDARDGLAIGSVWWLGSGQTATRAGLGFKVVDRRPTVNSVVAMCLAMPFEEIDVWRATIAMPARDPGVLDLVVDIETRPRELLVNGDRFAPDLIAFMASKAPKRARRPG